MVLVLSSPTESRNGTRVTCTKITRPRPISLRIWRIASRNGSDSMSPTVPPTSTMTTSAFDAAAAWRMRSLMALVMWGITCTVAPRKSPRRSFLMTES